MEEAISSIAPTNAPSRFAIASDQISQGFIALSSKIIYLLSLQVTKGVVIALAVGILVFALWVIHRRRRKGTLTFRLEQVLKEKGASDRWKSYRNFLQELYLPSFKSVGAVLIATLVLFVLAHNDFANIFYWLKDFAPLKSVSDVLAYGNNDHYQNLIAIHAGIGAIIFALLIFIAESLRDDETKDRARVLLRESFLFPLTVAEIAGFFILIWGDVNFWAVFSILIVAVFTVASLGRLLAVLLSKSRFAKKRLKMLKERIRQSIDLAISERFGTGIFLESLGENKTELDYNPWPPDSDEQRTHHLLYADKTGVVTDIRLDKLSQFAKRVETEANKNGFSFYKDKARPAAGDASAQALMGEARIDKYVQKDRQYVNKKYRDEVTDKYLTLFSIDKDTVTDEAVVEELRQMAREIFVIKKQDNFSEEIKLEIDGLKDQFIRAIEEKKLGKISELIKVYDALAESFLEAINAVGGGYSYEQARKERTALFGGWNEIKWLEDSVREILIKAVQSHDQEIVREVAYLPVHIAIKAINYGDQYVYQEFLTYPTFLYYLAQKETDEQLRKFMTDRSWRHLKEMSDYYIEHQLKRKAQDAKTIRQYSEYTIPIFAAFQNLLKTAFDKGEVHDFNVFLDKFLSLYDDLDDYPAYPRTEHLRFDLERTTDPKVKEVLQQRIELSEEREKAMNDIKRKKRQVTFGLAAWILEQYRNNRESDPLRQFYGTIWSRLPNDLLTLTEILVSSRDFDTEHFWNWDNWEMIPDGGVQNIDFSSKLDRLYCVRALHILRTLSEEEIAVINLPPSRDLAFLAEERPNDQHTLMGKLDEIAANAEQWSFALPQQAVDKIPALKRLLSKAKDAQEAIEDTFLESVEIDPKKLQEFEDKLTSAFVQHGIVRPALKLLGAYIDKTDQIKEGVHTWGYNQIDRKEAFIEKWHVHYTGWGENYGRGMATSENQLIFEQMLSAAGTNRDIARENALIEIDTVLSTSGMSDPIILMTFGRTMEHEVFRDRERFIQRYDPQCPKTPFAGIHGFIGVLKNGEQHIPVIELFVQKGTLNGKILIADLPKFGTLTQYSPIESPDKEKYRKGIFMLKVTDLNKDDERRNKILTDNPQWLQEHDEPEAYLRRQVLVHLFEKFEFVVSHAEAAIALTVAEMATPDEESQE